MNHASSNHPWAVNYLQQISDCSLDSVEFPTLKKDLILKEEENYFIEDTDYISIKEEPLETTYLTEEKYVESDGIETLNPNRFGIESFEFKTIKFEKEQPISENINGPPPEMSNIDIQENRMLSFSKLSMKKVKNGTYSCKYCPRTFKYFKNFQVHEETQACLTKFSCKHCGKKLSSNENLQKHEMIHTGEKPHKCKNCDMSFLSINSLKRHELVHTGAKPYSCQYCEKTFRHTASLVGHERIHIGQKPYSCQFCKKKFRQLGAWKNHELIHTNEKPFSCEICQKSFRQESSFRRHKLIHADVKPYSCKYCFKKIRHETALKEHERLHTGETPYSCQICNKTFRQQGALRYHEKVKKCQITSFKKKNNALAKNASEKPIEGKKEIKKENLLEGIF